MAEPREDEGWSRKAIVDSLKDIAWLAGAAIVVAGIGYAAWEKLEGVRPVVIALTILFLALLVAAFFRWNRKHRKQLEAAMAKARGDATEKALAEVEKADIDQPLDAFLLVEPYCDPRRQHGIVVRRGGHVSDFRVSVRLGVRVSNYSRHSVRVREVKDVSLYYGKSVIHSEGGLRLVENTEEIEGNAMRVYVHTIDVPLGGSPMLYQAKPHSINVSGVLMVAGEWGEDSKPIRFAEEILAPMRLDYTYEMIDAVERIRSGLEAQHVKMIDADLWPRPDGEYEWRVSAAPMVATTVDGGRKGELARTKDATDKVVQRTIGIIRAQFGEPRSLRIAEDATTREAERELVAEDEAGGDAEEIDSGSAKNGS